MIRSIAASLFERTAGTLLHAAFRLRGKAPPNADRMRAQQREADRKAREAAQRSDADEVLRVDGTSLCRLCHQPNRSGAAVCAHCGGFSP